MFLTIRLSTAGQMNEQAKRSSASFAEKQEIEIVRPCAPSVNSTLYKCLKWYVLCCRKEDCFPV